MQIMQIMLLKIMNQIKLYGKPIRVNKATSDKKNLDVDASLFIRNLDPDAAIDAMNGQYLMNKPITVSYAFKKDGKGERHGSAAGSYFFRIECIAFNG
ncbi:hypothetical protein GLOIN_2v1584026 [Rhizophagus irregularis DAOM 181602=DAOM 197198]|uniref:RRM domain-containing protein n=1 Tax=Rhizophagus irregularis (strain DAOM 181602 / DAOM 197198 / MUCL 43194) TaxID=747089 RepID=A0A2P4Q7N6_RHIID|nr:hypothetical protein GLOIN_2v1584026 [Rhizophagus irregularis DAOM 181602=DAOM 197198]POG73639.1 hypothetical protein GLOIN_2v1584026 [Rhizophagus irregularis DAOM 181602=DAOM 197198]|eukprot:XP_025180505.1 hypothetical protein GLOIN_2v1584026 [Rhizophagus irregularis DAOM 181602=DAOM 197198]